MKRIALTGGIGSGKSTIASIFDWYSVPIFYTDDEVKKLYKNRDIRDKVIKEFGEESYITHYDPNYPFLIKIFSDKSMMDKLTNIIYPSLELEWNKFCELYKHKPYVLYESALIFEYNRQSNFDKVILVTASIETRIRRVMQRNKISKEKVLERINLQMSDELKIEKSNYIIYNETLESLLNIVDKIHNELCDC